MSTISDLIAVIDAYRLKREVSDARVSTLIFNDGRRVGHIRDGKSDIGSNRLARAMQWLSDHWPEGAAWPENVDRPALTPPEIREASA